MFKNSIIYLLVSIFFQSIVVAGEIKLLRTFINVGDLVFDIGAHEGLKTDLYLALGAHVVCVEPQPVCIAHLQSKYATNARVTIEAKGLSFVPGFLEFAICSSANTISTFSKEWQSDGRFSSHGYTWDKKITVRVDTLDNLIQQYGVPKFCKIDVENFEYEVLKGLTKVIPVLSLEFAIETLHNTEKCIQHLVSLGYRSFNFTIGAQYKFMLPQWVGADELLGQIRYTAKYNNNDAWGLLMGDVYARYEK